MLMARRASPVGIISLQAIRIKLVCFAYGGRDGARPSRVAEYTAVATGRDPPGGRGATALPLFRGSGYANAFQAEMKVFRYAP